MGMYAGSRKGTGYDWILVCLDALAGKSSDSICVWITSRKSRKDYTGTGRDRTAAATLARCDVLGAVGVGWVGGWGFVPQVDFTYLHNIHCVAELCHQHLFYRRIPFMSLKTKVEACMGELYFALASLHKRNGTVQTF
jgi:hypothetical protein